MRFGQRVAQALQRAWLRRGVLSLALMPIALLYGALVWLRRGAYALGLRRTVAVPVPVIVVGNLIAGGAGKTPTVLAVVDLLRRRGHVPGIVSRGHGRVRSQAAVLDVLPGTSVERAGDEPLLLRLRSGAPVCVAADRVAAAQALLQRHPQVNVIVSDDGLQHLRLTRDVQVLVFDERGIGNGRLLPAGPLREPVPPQVPPRTVVLYNAARPSTPWPGSTARRALAGAVSLQAWWDGTAPRLDALQALRGRAVLAAAGLARPQRFFDMLREHGLQITPLPLPDHFDFATLPWPDGSEVVVTEKDAVKLRPHRIGATRVWVAALDYFPDAAFEAALLALLPGNAARPPP